MQTRIQQLHQRLHLPRLKKTTQKDSSPLLKARNAKMSACPLKDNKGKVHTGDEEACLH